MKDIIILGSGISILNLTTKEKEYINSCTVKIAINKFMAFYKKSGILPSHVYYVDDYEKNVKDFLKYIFNVCRKDNLQNINFILNKSILRDMNIKQAYRKILVSNSVIFYLKKLYRKMRYREKEKLIDFYLIPKNCTFEFISHQDWLNSNQWATSLDQPLFHYRGSLTTVLNYVSIKYPGQNIYLVGVDFNSPKYFFQDDLEALSIPWQDFTTPLVKETGNHFSVIDYKGTTIFDKFSFIMDNLLLSKNKLYSTNPNSLLTLRGFVEYKSLL